MTKEEERECKKCGKSQLTLYMCSSVVYRCVDIRCCYSSASVSCKVLVGGTYFIVVCVAPFEWGLQRDFCGIRHAVSEQTSYKLAELHAGIEIELETLRATPNFAHRVCHILCNRCLACIVEGGSQFEHKM